MYLSPCSQHLNKLRGHFDIYTDCCLVTKGDWGETGYKAIERKKMKEKVNCSK